MINEYVAPFLECMCHRCIIGMYTYFYIYIYIAVSNISDIIYKIYMLIALHVSIFHRYSIDRS